MERLSHPFSFARTLCVGTLGSLVLVIGGCEYTRSVNSEVRDPLFLIVEGGKYGFINNKGEVAIPPQFAYAFPFAEGRAQVVIDQPSGHPKHGFIDERGELVIPAIYDNASSFSEGLAKVGMGDSQGRNIENWGFVNIQGTVVIPLKFRSTGDFHEGLAAFSAPHDRSFPEYSDGFINREGDVIIPPRFNTMQGAFDQGLACVRKWRGNKEHWGAINKSGELVIEYKYAAPFVFSDGLALAYDDTYRWIDSADHTSLGPFTDWEDAKPFSDGLAAFRKHNKWGFINKDGMVVISPRYDYAHSFHEGLAAIVKANQYGFIDADDRLVIEPTFEAIHLSNDGFSEGMCRMNKGTHDVWIDLNGNTVYSFHE